MDICGAVQDMQKLPGLDQGTKQVVVTARFLPFWLLPGCFFDCDAATGRVKPFVNHRCEEDIEGMKESRDAPELRSVNSGDSRP